MAAENKTLLTGKQNENREDKEAQSEAKHETWSN